MLADLDKTEAKELKDQIAEFLAARKVVRDDSDARDARAR